MKRDYSFAINYRVRRGSKRETKLLEIAHEYNLEPGCRLIQRLIDDRHLISQERAVRKAEALRQKEQAEKELRALVAGSD